MLTGRVVAFDERRGDGQFLSDDGERFYFHCVSIVGGSRTIEVGRASAQRVAGRRGRDEVVNVTALAEGSPANATTPRRRSAGASSAEGVG